MGAVAPPPPLATLLSLGYNILQIMDQGMWQQSATPIGLAVLGLSNLRIKSKITLMQRPYNDNSKLLSCITCMFGLLFLFHSPCCLSFLPLSFLQFSFLCLHLHSICICANFMYSSGLRNVQSVQMHRGPPLLGGPHLTYRAQKNLIAKNYSKL